jgi:hypothetical protein
MKTKLFANTKLLAIALTFLGSVAVSVPAQAQFMGPVGGPIMAAGIAGGGGYGSGGGRGYFGGGSYAPFYASTAVGSNLLGAAALTSAAGQATLDASMAAVNAQNAYQHWIENQKLREQTYFDMRRMNASYRAESRSKPATPEQLISFSKARLPDRLTPDQLDQERGQIKWPQVLMREDFAPMRAALEYLFAERAAHPYSTGLGTDNYREIRGVTDDLHDVLRNLLNDFSPDEFIAGNKFVNSLAYEARFEPDTSPLR